MDFSLPSELLRFVEKKVKDGLYQDERDVICAALRGMRARDGLLHSDFAGLDIEGIVSIVMMEAARSAAEDLRMIMEEMKAMTAAKQKMRDLISEVSKDVAQNAGQMRQTPPLNFSAGMGSEKAYHTAAMPIADPQSVGGVKLVPTDLYEGEILDVQHLRAIQEELRDKLDSMSEMSEMTALRLQVAMDRRSKMMSALSNILKKISSTQESIVQNLK